MQPWMPGFLFSWSPKYFKNSRIKTRRERLLMILSRELNPKKDLRFKQEKKRTNSQIRKVIEKRIIKKKRKFKKNLLRTYVR